MAATRFVVLLVSVVATLAAAQQPRASGLPRLLLQNEDTNSAELSTTNTTRSVPASPSPRPSPASRGTAAGLETALGAEAPAREAPLAEALAVEAPAAERSVAADLAEQDRPRRSSRAAPAAEEAPSPSPRRTAAAEEDVSPSPSPLPRRSAAAEEGAASPSPSPSPRRTAAATEGEEDASRSPKPSTSSATSSLPGADIPGCPEYIDTTKYKTTDFTDTLNTTVSISLRRPSARVPAGQWIQGRATFYGTDERVEASRVACGEPAGQFGVIAQGSCGYTNSDGSLPFPREVYAAVADTNEDYPGSCGRCYQVRCRTGVPTNNGRPLRMSDLIYARPYQIKDNFGTDWPGNPREKEDLFGVICRDEAKTITVRVGDSCPCQYPIRADGGTGEVTEIRTQNWCCGGNNHFDLSFWAFEELAHPSYGIIPIEYRPVNCQTNTPLTPVPGFINQTIYSDSIQPGWNWLPYNAKNTVLLAEGQGVDGSVATCSTLSIDGAVKFQCRQCSRTGYQPFAKADSLRFDIRSNTKSTDEFASSTPPGELPGIKLFMMNSDASTYCGAEVSLSTAPTNATLTEGAQYAERLEAGSDWFRVTIPLAAFACAEGSVGGLRNVDRVDFQNINIRDADICLDNIQLV